MLELLQGRRIRVRLNAKRSNIENVQTFIIRGVLSDAFVNSSVNYRPSEVEKQTYNVKDTLSEFDFIDGEPANGLLRDAEHTGGRSDQTYTQDSRIIIDGVEHYAQSLWIADATFTFDDGHKISLDTSIRLFTLATEPLNKMTGDIVANPLDSSRVVIREYLAAHPGVNFSSFTIDAIRDDKPLDYTKIRNEDDPFLICFAAGVLIETSAGARPIEELCSGDLVLTLDHGYQPIRWIGSRQVSTQELASNFKFRPIRINVGALGDNRPSTPLMVSRQHRIMIKSHWAHELFGTDEVLIPAIKLTGIPGIGIAHDIGIQITYYHILLDDHEILLSNGAFSESLYLGPQALGTLSPEGREEIAIMFPEIINGKIPAPQSRPFVQRKKHVREALLKHY